MNITVNTALQAIQGLMSINASGKLPMQLSLDIAHNMRQLQFIQEQFNENRAALLEEHGEPDDKGNVTIPKENMEKFNSEMQGMVKEEVEINARQIKASAFPEEGFVIEPMALVALEWMILEE